MSFAELPDTYNGYDGACMCVCVRVYVCDTCVCVCVDAYYKSRLTFHV